MGGIWGLAASTALENLPVEARGLASGFLQEGYAVGYLIAAVNNLFIVPEVKQGWRALFWVSAGLSLSAATIRVLLPESEVFLRAKAAEVEKGHTTTQKTKVFLKETGDMLKKHWLLCIYAVLLMTGRCRYGHLLFSSTFPSPYSRNPFLRRCNFLEIPATERLTLIYSIRLQFPLPWIAGDYPFITQPHTPSVSNVSKFTASSSKGSLSHIPHSLQRNIDGRCNHCDHNWELRMSSNVHIILAI